VGSGAIREPFASRPTSSTSGAAGRDGQIARRPVQADRDLEILERFSASSTAPRSAAGRIQTKGTYTSAKTLEQLAEAIDTVIGRMWDIMGVTIQHTLEACYRMDEKLWPTPQGHRRFRKGRSYTDEYTPTKDIAGHYKVNVDYGSDSVGYQASSCNFRPRMPPPVRRGAIEEMPGVSDVDEKMREIELESLDDATQAHSSLKPSRARSTWFSSPSCERPWRRRASRSTT